MPNVKTPLMEEAGRVQEFGPDDVVGPESGGTGLKTVGADGQVLMADSTATNGIKWGDIPTPAVPVGSQLFLFFAYRGL